MKSLVKGPLYQSRNGLNTCSLQPYAYIYRVSKQIERQSIRERTFPVSKLIIHGQRHTFLEYTLVISSQPNYELVHLHSQTDVKILGDVAIGPELSRAVLFE